MTSSSREKHRTTVCRLAFALLLSAPPLLHGQQTTDSTPQTTPAAPPAIDRHTIDVAAIVRDGTARTLSDVLMSQVPGLLVVRGSGLNGTGASVRFAGVRSLVADLPPLMFLDGMRIDAREDDTQLLGGVPGPSRLDDVPVEDVQSIEVLRGPASTAIYGPGAAAGVILIRTKHGRSGPVRLEGFAHAAVRSVPSRWPANYGGVDLDNANTFMRQGACSLRAQAAGSCVQDFVQSFNPLAERSPFGSAPRGQLGLSATAGPDWGAFRLSGTLDGEAAMYDVPAVSWNDDYSQWNLRASGSLQPARNLDVLTSFSRTSSRLRLPQYAPVIGALLGPSDSAGFTWTPLFGNPGTQDVDRTSFAVDVRGQPLPWLEVQGMFGLDDVNQQEHARSPGTSRIEAARRGGQRTIRINASAPDIPWGGLRFSTILGFERILDHEQSNSELVRPDTAVCGVSATFCSRFRSDLRINVTGLYAVEQVAFRGRLFFTGSLRHDEYDDPESWSTTHPSLAVDWVARPEQEGALGRLAFRAAYGTSAHSIPTLVGTISITPGPQLKPERTRAWEFRADASAFTGRLRAQASIYDLRSDVIDYQLAPSSVGFVTVYRNGAVIGNRGVTASVSATMIDRTSWGWDLRLALWGNRNRLLEQTGPPVFYLDPTRFTGQREIAGFPVNGYWGRPLGGFADANGDGIISPTEVNPGTGIFTWAGTPYPTQGAVLTSAWRFTRRWRVSATLDYRAGQTIYNEIANWRCRVELCRESNDPASSLADQATAVAANLRPLSYFEDADYLKLRELAIVFDVPEATAATFGARAATIMLGGRDLVTWSKYSGVDPEAAGYGTRTGGTPMVISDLVTMPIPRSWTLRVRVSY